jgi:hypothetical protein
MSAAIHNDRTGIDKQDQTDMDKEMIYMTRLSREVGNACDAFFARRNGLRSLTMKEIITGYAKRGELRKLRRLAEDTLTGDK